MKWGVRRSRKRLGNRVTKLGAKNERLTDKVKSLDKAAKTYDAKSAKMISRNSKYEARLSKAMKAMDAGTIQQGRLFMQYVTE